MYIQKGWHMFLDIFPTLNKLGIKYGCVLISSSFMCHDKKNQKDEENRHNVGDAIVVR